MLNGAMQSCLPVPSQSSVQRDWIGATKQLANRYIDIEELIPSEQGYITVEPWPSANPACLLPGSRPVRECPRVVLHKSPLVSALSDVLGPTRTLLGSTSTLLGPTWAHLGPTWTLLGPTWSLLGANLDSLGANLDALRANLGALGANLEPT